MVFKRVVLAILYLIINTPDSVYIFNSFITYQPSRTNCKLNVTRYNKLD